MCLIAILFQALCTMPPTDRRLGAHNNHIDSTFQKLESATPLLSASLRYHLQTNRPSFDLHQFRGLSWLKRGPSSTFICFPCKSAGHTVSFDLDSRTDNLKRHGQCHRHTCAVAKMLELPMPKYPRHVQTWVRHRRSVRPPCLSDFKELLHHLRSGGSFLQGTANMSHHKAVCAMHPVLFLDIRLLHNFNACV